MPSFNVLPDQDKDAIVAFLFNLEDKRLYQVNDKESKSATIKDTRKRYSLKGVIQLKDQDGYPGIKPPWGTLNAVNLNSGDIAWKFHWGNFLPLRQKGTRIQARNYSAAVL